MIQIPKNFFMAWGGSTPPAWCLRSFDEYKSGLGPHWNCELFTTLDVPDTYVLKSEQAKLPFYTYKSDIFRLWLMDEFGGIWVDTDTRMVKCFDDLLYHEAVVTVHRDTPNSPLDSFHTDSCMIGSVKQGRMTTTVIDRVYDGLKNGRGYHQFTWNFYHTLMGRIPDFIHIGAFDEITDAQEREDFINCRFDPVIPKRSNSYIRHYLTNLYKNAEGKNV